MLRCNYKLICEVEQGPLKLIKPVLLATSPLPRALWKSWLEKTNRPGRRMENLHFPPSISYQLRDERLPLCKLTQSTHCPTRIWMQELHYAEWTCSSFTQQDNAISRVWSHLDLLLIGTKGYAATKEPSKNCSRAWKHNTDHKRRFIFLLPASGYEEINTSRVFR